MENCNFSVFIDSIICFFCYEYEYEYDRTFTLNLLWFAGGLKLLRTVRWISNALRRFSFIPFKFEFNLISDAFTHITSQLEIAARKTKIPIHQIKSAQFGWNWSPNKCQLKSEQKQSNRTENEIQSITQNTVCMARRWNCWCLGIVTGEEEKTPNLYNKHVDSLSSSLSWLVIISIRNETQSKAKQNLKKN